MSDFRFDFKTFTELKNAQSVALGLRRTESAATDLHVPEALLQRREQVLFPATRGWRTLMTTRALN